MEDQMDSKIIKFAIFSSIVASLLLTIACSKITQENYNKLKVGQDYDEVVKILGKADECSGAIGIQNCSWGDEKRFIKVKFAGNKVILFSAQGL